MSYSSVVLADSPQIFYEFNETSGDAVDSVSGVVATNNGAVTYDSSGPNGARAANFNGTNQALMFSTAPFMGGDYTMEAWAKPASDLGSTLATIIRSEGGGREATLRVDGGSTPSGGVYAYASGRATWTAGDYRTGTWFHVAAVVTAANTKIYVNGILTSTTTSGSRTVAYETSQTAAIGANPSLAERFRGAISRVAIYPTALTQAQLNTHYLAGAAPRAGSANYDSAVLTDSPWGFWKADDASGTSIADASGNGRTATLSATAQSYAQPGLTGNGIDLAGQYFNLPTATALQGSGKSITVEMILTPTNLKGGTPKDFYGFGGETRFSRSSDAGRPYGVIQTALGDSTAGSHESASVLRNGTAYHLAWTYDAATGATVVYVNGTAAHSFTAATNGFIFSGAATVLHAATNGRETHGRVQRVAVYPTALSSTRIAAHYSAATTVGPSSAVALAGTLPVIQEALTFAVRVGTATANRVNGRRREGVAYLTDATPPDAAPPVGVAFGMKVEKALVYPNPTLVDGRPT